MARSKFLTPQTHKISRLLALAQTPKPMVSKAPPHGDRGAVTDPQGTLDLIIELHRVIELNFTAFVTIILIIALLGNASGIRLES